MSLFDPLWRGVLLPAVVSAVLLALAWRPWRRGAAVHGTWAGPVALAAAYVAGHAALEGWPSFPPKTSIQWLFYMAPAVALIGLVAASAQAAAWVRWALRALCSFGVPVLLLWRKLEHAWEPGEAAIWMVGLGLSLLALWTTLEPLGSGPPSAALPLSLLVTTAGGSVVIAAFDSLSLGQLAGVIAASLGALVLFAFWRTPVGAMAACIPVALPLLASVWLSSYFWSYTPPSSATLLAASPLMAWFGRLPPIRRQPAWVVAGVSAAAALIPVVLALFLALPDSW